MLAAVCLVCLLESVGSLNWSACEWPSWRPTKMKVVGRDLGKEAQGSSGTYDCCFLESICS